LEITATASCGLCNGVTGGRWKPDDIDFNSFAVTGRDED
jgi:hypothetical protein